MIKRIIEISQHPARLSLRADQLLIRLRGDEGEPERETSIPCEDVGVLVVDHPQVSFTHQVLSRLVEFGAVVVLCGRDHLPAGVLLPVAEHTQVVWRLNDQVGASKPLRKRLWQQIVRAKIRAQADNLPKESPARRRLAALVREVKSGDPKNVEAQAARVYWGAWMGRDERFRRDRDGDGLNALLNYGYAVVRAAVARAVVAAGLQAALGIHHSNRSNAFCLADDLLEPLRPMVDARARKLWSVGCRELSQEVKAELLGVLHATVRVEQQEGPLMVALHRMTASLARCLAGEDKRLLIPTDAEDGS